MENILNKEIERLAYRRFYSCKKRSEELNITPPKLTDILFLINKSIKEGFKCFYCKKNMVLKSNYPYKYSPSLEHKTPLGMGGTNEINNLVICCHSCNIIKGTLYSNTYIELLKKIDDENLLNRIFLESFNGKFANKLERNDLEKLGILL